MENNKESHNEIERKFLMTGFPNTLENDCIEKATYKQFYTSIYPEVRFREKKYNFS